MTTRLSILLLLLSAMVLAPLSVDAALTPVDDRDEVSLEESASMAFYSYLEAVDAGELDEATEQVLDPGDMAGRAEVNESLMAFMRGRQKSPVRNEACIVRTAGDWAMVVYQYDTTIAGKTARVITTAWMLQFEGFWQQFLVAPPEEEFWDDRQSDYELLQDWFDEHAEALVPQA